MSLRIIDWKSGVVTTIDATTGVVCSSDPLANSSTVTFEVNVEARDIATGEIASTTFLHRARTAAGVTTLVGAPTVLVTFAQGSDAALAAALATLVPIANVVQLQVTGVAGRTLEWFGDVRIRNS